MKSLFETIKAAEAEKYAIGHFNVSTLDAVWGIINAAKKLDKPVVIGVSEGERDFMGIKVVAAIVKTIREEQQYPIFLNADHTYSLERVKEVVEAGFDSVIFDGADLPHEENTKKAKEVVDYVKSVRWQMLVEAEIGYIGKSSALLEEIPKDAAVTEDAMPTAAEAKAFVEATGVDLIAPAVGNIHGMLKNAPQPRISIQRIKEIHAATSAPIVLHGGSGISDQDFNDAIAAGVSYIHINTEIRKAWRDGLKATIAAKPDEVAPYKLLQEAQAQLEEVVKQRLTLFSQL
jgi:fructose-bisphosphate aldolase, class II